jgi:glycosyltransferase involved in cell wall biosynthesis
MKMVALTSVSGPYIIARWSAFTTQLSCSIALIEFGRISDTYHWQPLDMEVPYQRLILSEQSAESQSPFNLIHLLMKELARIKPDILILNGYAQPATLSALAWSLLHRKPAILLSASKADDAPRSWWKETFKSWLLKVYKAALVGGKPHKRYLIKLGMSADAIFLGYDVVGNEAFHPDKIRCLPKPLDRPYFLTINRFIPKKNLLFLLSCYAAYRQKAGSHPWDLVLCGDGPLRPQIEQRITELSLQDFVHLPGFLQQDELLPYFAHASCFIHASIQEQWGLVVNEAMAAGLPVLVSNRCGCFEDLVIEGFNGFGFDPENSQQLTDLMLTVTSGDVDMDKMGNAAFEHIQNFSPDHFAQGLVQAVEYALAHR